MQPWIPSLTIGLAALAWAIWSGWRNERRLLTIHQHGDNVINCVHHPRDLCTIFMIEVSVTNNSPKRNIVIADYWLEVPWKEDGWWPVYDSKENEEKNYRVYNTFIDYPRDMAINHRRFEEGKLSPGDTIRGLFFAHGTASIPTDLYRDEWIRAQFIVIDTEGKRYVKSIGLWPHPNWPPGPSEPQLPLPDYELEGFDADPNAVIHPMKGERLP
jgi:hypothetical protein